MTNTRKLEYKVPESKMTTTDELKGAELDKVSGGMDVQGLSAQLKQQSTQNSLEQAQAR
jgi:hypothetical protein